MGERTPSTEDCGKADALHVPLVSAVRWLLLLSEAREGAVGVCSPTQGEATKKLGCILLKSRPANMGGSEGAQEFTDIIDIFVSVCLRYPVKWSLYLKTRTRRCVCACVC